jgi:ABC-2 type transport system permease protein
MTNQPVSASGNENRLASTPNRALLIDTQKSLMRRALGDLWMGLVDFRRWGALAWSDMRRQYRRSTFGPFWITLSMAVFICLLGLLYSGLFNRPVEIFIPHLTAGIILYRVISGTLEEGSRCFINAEGVIKQMAAPLSIHAYRVVASQMLTLAHHSIVFAAVALTFRIMPTTQWLYAGAGLLLFILTGVWVCLLAGLASVRFRDIPQMLQSVTLVIFFLTPVIWMADSMPRRALFLQLNPFYHYIELVRAPLLNQAIDPRHWLFAIGVTIAGWIVTLFVYRRFRPRVAYWL